MGVAVSGWVCCLFMNMVVVFVCGSVYFILFDYSCWCGVSFDLRFGVLLVDLDCMIVCLMLFVFVCGFYCLFCLIVYLGCWYLLWVGCVCCVVLS